MPKVADLLAQTLKAYGTEYLFCVMGGDHGLFMGLQECRITAINCRSEQAATYMADGYARISGKPGFVYGQFGPGVANIAGSLAEPFWSSSPVISLTSSIRTTSRDRFEYQEIDQLPMHEPVTRFNREVHRADRAAELLRAAIRAATNSPVGPAHLEIPADILRSDTPEEDLSPDSFSGCVPGLRTAPPALAVSALLDALLTSERPVIIAGNGVVMSEAWDELTTLAELLSIPVATSNSGKGSISELHDLSIGLMGRTSRKVANDIVREADLAFVIGCKLGGMVTDTYTIPSASTRILQLDVDATVLGATYREEMSLLGDAKLSLAALIDEVKQRGAQRARTSWGDHATQAVAAWKAELVEVASRDTAPIHPASAIVALREVLDDDGIIVADTGFMGGWAGALFPVHKGGRSYIRAAGSLGWGLPASLGAQVAAPSDTTSPRSKLLFASGSPP
jgi:acetolactate synthase I/II/III large subunit